MGPHMLGFQVESCLESREGPIEIPLPKVRSAQIIIDDRRQGS